MGTCQEPPKTQSYPWVSFSYSLFLVFHCRGSYMMYLSGEPFRRRITLVLWGTFLMRLFSFCDWLWSSIIFFNLASILALWDFSILVLFLCLQVVKPVQSSYLGPCLVPEDNLNNVLEHSDEQTPLHRAHIGPQFFAEVRGLLPNETKKSGKANQMKKSTFKRR